jgi:hypothetical protein
MLHPDHTKQKRDPIGQPIPVEPPQPLIETTALDRIDPGTLQDVAAATRAARHLGGLDDAVGLAVRATSGFDVGRLWVALLELKAPDVLASRPNGVNAHSAQAAAAAKLVQVLPADVAAVLAVEAALAWPEVAAFLARRTGAAVSPAPDAHSLVRYWRESADWLSARVVRTRAQIAAAQAAPDAKE